MNKRKIALRGAGLACALALAACTTTAQFQLPPQTSVRFDNRPQLYPAGAVETRPYFWNSTSGIRYQLEQDGKVVGEGRVQAKFRPASIFWPPYALIYWPMGFAQSCYDLTGDKPAPCK
jgi:hypothetical protein